MRDGEKAAAKAARSWKLDHDGNTVYFTAPDFDALYTTLLRICYFTPFVERILPFALPLYNAYGRRGLVWTRKQLK
ncbi:hypothetical protein KQH42_30415, partial [Streptomyces sp. CHA1]|uniref:hypothetical protein n=1 Tax=Streptomyces sp. CHA1 TaxID=2841663 RepID=UPI0020944182